MKQNIPIHQKPFYNDAVQEAFDYILKSVKQLLATVERDELRCYFERKRAKANAETIVHEIISPLLYLRLQCEVDGLLSIRFGIEPCPLDDDLANLTSDFLRILFRATDEGSPDINIERCVKTDWFINVCSDMYEYVDLQQKHHRLKKVPYKAPSSKKRALTIA